MIRAACKCGVVVNRAAITVGRRNSNALIVPIRSFSAVAPQTSESALPLPSNLTFDRKSSFAPKGHPFLVPPKDEDEDYDDDEIEGGEVDSGYESGESEEEGDAVVAKLERDTVQRYVVSLPGRLKADVHGADGSVNGSLWLEPSVFGRDPIRVDLIKQAVDYIRNKIRGVRKAKSKTISEVSGSGRKVRAQKGSGNARAGHSRPAHWRGGAKAHGPKNTVDYGNVKMNKKARRLAMVSTLSQKLKEGNLIVVDNLKLESHKTKDLASMLEDAYGIGKDGSSALVLDHYLEPEDSDEDSADASYHGIPINLWVASGNLYKIKVASQRYTNVYDILKREKLILTLTALEQMEARWKD
jgi:large subunit ribosomal protein L4